MSTVTLETNESFYESLVQEKPLAAIDYMLHQIQLSAESKCDNTLYLTHFCEAILNHVAPDWDRSRKPQSLLFDPQVITKPRFAAICLLRLFAHAPSVFHGEFKHKAINLLDKELSKDVYTKCGVDIKDQAFEKEKKLSAFVAEIEGNLKELAVALHHITGLSTFQQDFLRRLNAADRKGLIKPFIPSNLWEQRLVECFSAVTNYAVSSGTNSLSSYHAALEILDSYLEEIESLGTYYAKEFLGAAVETLKKVTTEHFHNSPLSKPANLRVIASDKKYPLHKADSSFDLMFVVVNDGPGVAVHAQLELTDACGLTATDERRVFLGTLEPETKLQAEIRVIANKAQDDAFVEIAAEWENYDQTTSRIRDTYEIQPQRGDIDWDALASMAAYSLDPVEVEADLVGRRDILDKLTGRVRNRTMTSSYIQGQKRVGKTSIVNALKDRISQSADKTAWVYLLAGDVNVGDALATCGKLANRLCRLIQLQDKRLSLLTVPDSSEDLTSVVTFLDEAKVLAADLKIIIVLDEFDELPFELFRDTPVGNAFFSTLRSLSSRPNVCFILVGSENMNFALSWQGDRLNKFAAHSVDYFDKENHWSDFRSLVCAPVKDWLEINDEAVESVYEQTAGNPFFTKLLCDDVYKSAVERRDGYVTRREIEESVRTMLPVVGATSFQHFWKDGLLTAQEGAEDRSIMRRKVLLTLAETLNSGLKPTKEQLASAAPRYHLPVEYVEPELNDFVNRRVLICTDGEYRPKVPLFERWLCEHGHEEVLVRLTDEDAALVNRKRMDTLRIKPEEIVALTKKWPCYKGQQIGTDNVRAWLNQFGPPNDQRLMFELLKQIRFYSQAQVRQRMKDAYDFVERDMAKRGVFWSKPAGALRRHDLLVSHLDVSPGKSGSHYARIFAEENNVLMENVVSRQSISRALATKTQCQGLIFVDDIIGTGRTAIDNLRAIHDENPDLFVDTTDEVSLPLVYVITICGYIDAQSRVEKELARMGINACVRVCDVLTDEDKCFSSESSVISDENVRSDAKNVAYRFGKNLEPKHPLGYGNCESLVVFEASCPNNSLPILWKEKPDWLPLFKRG